MSEATRWHVIDGAGDLSSFVCDESGSVICNCHDREHSRLIVKAANSHDALLEACKAARREFGHLIKQMDLRDGSSVERVYSKCADAIAGAE